MFDQCLIILADPTVGDAMALDKDGYVNKNMFASSQKSLSHMSYMCPGNFFFGERFH